MHQFQALKAPGYHTKFPTISNHQGHGGNKWKELETKKLECFQSFAFRGWPSPKALGETSDENWRSKTSTKTLYE
jgi:hypothetical protein